MDRGSLTEEEARVLLEAGVVCEAEEGAVRLTRLGEERADVYAWCGLVAPDWESWTLEYLRREARRLGSG